MEQGENAFSGKLLRVLVVSMFLQACAPAGLIQHPPVESGARIAVNSLVPVDRLQKEQVRYKELQPGGRVPADGTSELYPEGQKDCSGPGCMAQYGAATAAATVGLVAAPILLPIIAVQSGREARLRRTASPPCSSAVTLKSLNKAEEMTTWLRHVVFAEDGSAGIDSTYTGLLQNTLDRPASQALEREVSVLAGLSRLEILGQPERGEFFLLCSKAMVQSGLHDRRYFETCLTEPYCPPYTEDTEEGAQWLQDELGALVDKLAHRVAMDLVGDGSGR